MNNHASCACPVENDEIEAAFRFLQHCIGEIGKKKPESSIGSKDSGLVPQAGIEPARL